MYYLTGRVRQPLFGVLASAALSLSSLVPSALGQCAFDCPPAQTVCGIDLASSSNSPRGAGVCVKVDIVVDESELQNGCYELTEACGFAWAYVSAISWACGFTHDMPITKSDSDAACIPLPPQTYAVAAAGVDLNQESRNNIMSCALAFVHPLSSLCHEISLNSGYIYWPTDCSIDPGFQPGYPVGATAAVASASYAFNYTCETPPEIDVIGSADAPPVPDDGRSCRVVRVKLVCSGGTQTVCLKYCMFPNGIGSGNVTVNPDGSISINNSLSGCTGLNTLTADEFTFVEGAYDVNGDGRFNSADVTALTALINSTDPDTLANFDFNNNGIIDASDVAVLQGLIDCGLSAGTPGDLNGDGVINCADSCAAATAWGSDADDATYRVELDFDLDGDNDALDKDAFYALNPCLADFNRDGLITIDDLNLFLTAHWLQDPRADMNGSGSVTIDDYFLYMNLYFTLSC